MPNPADIVKHIVVLMLENRSFDHMLGYLKSQIPTLNGIDGTQWNPEDASNPVVRVQVSDDAGYLDLVEDPSHWTPDVLDQVYSVYKCGTKPPDLPGIGPNMSFVANYSYRNNNSLPDAHKIMRCFAPDKLPALTTLAREFAVCDSWYSSLPGQTWPNRMFVHAATSDGNIDNKLYDYDIDTIYHRLEDAGRSWKIFFHDIPQALALKRLRVDVFKDRFRLFHEFTEDARDGSLPDYSFIEPRYFDFAFKKANDQHPNHDVSLGDVLIADVYEAVRNSPLWEQTLLVILWDEHGGIYDHAFPPQPRVPSPDGKVNRDIDPPFNFDLLGVRVPAIMVSPYIAKSQVNHTQYEHASVPATLKKLFDLSDFLTERDKAASTFEEIISLDQPRTDTPAMLPRVPEAASLAARAAKLPFLLSAAQSLESEARLSVAHREACSQDGWHNSRDMERLSFDSAIQDITGLDCWLTEKLLLSNLRSSSSLTSIVQLYVRMRRSRLFVARRSMTFRICIPFLLISTVFAQQLSSSDRAAADLAIKQIRAQAIRARMRFLSDSMLTGRAPGTPGYDIAARYVASEVESMGLHPAGDKGTWYQQVPLRKAVVDEPQSSVEFIRDGHAQQLTNVIDYVFPGDVLRTESSVQAPVVFVGFGVTAPDQKYDDYAGADVKGKVVAYVYGAPARFPSTERAYYSDGVIKTKNAIAHGAIGILGFLSPEDQKRYPWKWLVPQIQAGQMHWLDDKGTPHNAFAEIRGAASLSQTGTEKLFTAAPHSLEQALATARSGQPQAFTLPVSVRIHRISKHNDLRSSNVIAELPGSDPALRDQYVVYTAHLDHLGICPPINGDNVCHGAVDNASGTSSLLEIARAYASLPHAPRRSVLFAFVTGEEMGLLGSDYFAYSPTVPRRLVVANVNIDGAPGLYYAMKDIVPLGAEHSTIGNDVELAARQMGYEISPDPMPEEVAFIRSDQYSFVLQGIPAVDISDGVKAADPKVDGLAVIKTWLTTRYHTPLDNMDQPLDYDSAAMASGLNFLVGYELAQQDQPPTWNSGDFFGTTFGQQHDGSSITGK